MKLFWENGHPKRETCFEEGLRSGVERFWNEEGLLVDEGEYFKGKPVGHHRRWNEKGLLIEEVFYLDEKRSQFRYWDETGQLRIEIVWPSQDLCMMKNWDASRKVMEEQEGTWDGNQVWRAAVTPKSAASLKSAWADAWASCRVF